MGWNAGQPGTGRSGDDPSRLTLQDGERLLRIARAALDVYLRAGLVEVSKTGASHTDERGVFCTVRSYPSGDLLGCMGCTRALGTLEESVACVAAWAAQDPRFPSLRREDLDRATLEVSVLSPLEPVQVNAPERFPSAVQPGLDGLALRGAGVTGLLLPQVWAKLPDPEEFFAVLCLKAGLPSPDAWRDAGVTLYRFQVQVFRERSPGGEVEEEQGPWRPGMGDSAEA